MTRIYHNQETDGLAHTPNRDNPTASDSSASAADSAGNTADSSTAGCAESAGPADSSTAVVDYYKKPVA